ncbi:RluA family pseudouridine synthase [Haloimpatiens lingqiaonensis]|uniref:RluA family pseudouridine synthase n=1 Tax=Haloimpatiens lingqiaonensis TaxID=1380675 RepID=UPI0010FD0875|nr:RluA family pseudouridine synthase [Haloimpatiens lingqiaonensis]
MKEQNNYLFKIEEEFDGERIDIFLAEALETKSRSYIQKLIKSGNATVNNEEKKSNYKLKENDIVELKIPEPIELNIKPENISLDILYEDSDVIVVNKSQGMVVHPAPGVYSGTLVNALLYHCRDLSGINGITRPGIVHRIDKDTSGVLVVAKNDNSHNCLAAQLKEHSMNREYIALTEGVVKEDEGKVDAPIGRHATERIKMAVISGGKEAITHFKVEKRYKNNTLIRCKLETGRTHQIRVHMAYIGHPLVGDPVYGYKKQKFKLQGQMLHAHKLGFIHPTTGQYIEFSTPIPDYFQNVIEKLENCL